MRLHRPSQMALLALTIEGVGLFERWRQKSALPEASTSRSVSQSLVATPLLDHRANRNGSA